jgi:hypothetical protein
MAGRRIWHLIYGGAFAALLAVSVLAVAANHQALWQEALKSARSLVDLVGDGPDAGVPAVDIHFLFFLPLVSQFPTRKLLVARAQTPSHG